MVPKKYLKIAYLNFKRDFAYEKYKVINLLSKIYLREVKF